MLPGLVSLLCSVAMVLLMTAAPPAVAQNVAQASSATGPLREMIRDRLAQRQASRQPPASDPDAPITTAGDYRYTITHGGLPRQFMVHVPATVDLSKPAPLLLSFHGGGGHMEFQAAEENYGQISSADREHAIVVFPNGYSTWGGRFATWNAGGCCGQAKTDNADDVGFVRAIVAQITRQLNIDRERIFATGFSNGSMLSHRLACEMADTFRAIAAVGGSDNTLSCSPSAPVSVLVIHARNDDHAAFDGGAGPKSRDRASMAQSRSIPDTVTGWVARNACTAPPRRELDRPGASCERHTDCRGGVSVALCVTERGAHSWPGAQKARSSEPPSTALSANQVMWNFFLGRPLD